MAWHAAWLTESEPAHPPRSSLGKAIRHALKNWERLRVFLDDVNVPVDNNASEQALRPVAKGRDNSLFAGNDEAAERLMVLLGLCTTCEALGINPETYLADVLERVADHPVAQLDLLLPHSGRRARSPDSCSLATRSCSYGYDRGSVFPTESFCQ